MARGAAGPQPEPERSLFGRTAGEDRGLDAQEFQRRDAALVQAVLRLTQQVGPRAVEKLDPLGATGFLIGEGEEDEVPLEGQARTLGDQEDEQFEDPHPLHIQGAAAPEAAVANGAVKRADLPMLGFRGHNVGVVEQHQGCLRAVAAQRGPQRHAPGARIEVLGGEPLALEDGAQEAGGGLLTAGRIRRVDAEVGLERIDDFGLYLRPVDGNRAIHESWERAADRLS